MKNRSQAELKSNVKLNQSQQNEELYFSSHEVINSDTDDDDHDDEYEYEYGGDD